MKGMIFAAGLGTRLRPLTDNCPKALVDVGGRPMLENVILKFKSAGIDEIVVNVHHFADQIIDFLRANNDFGIKLHISDERDQLLDTGGGILKAARWLDREEPFVVHNADIYTDFDLPRMIKAYGTSSVDAMLLIGERETSRYLLFSSDGRMVGWENVKTGEKRSPFTEEEVADAVPMAFGGVHIINPAIYPLLRRYSSEPKFSITPFYTDMCRELKIMGYTPSEHYNWVDIGKPESLMIARNIASAH